MKESNLFQYSNGITSSVGSGAANSPAIFARIVSTQKQSTGLILITNTTLTAAQNAMNQTRGGEKSRWNY